jgi:hypothetical protein
MQLRVYKGIGSMSALRTQAEARITPAMSAHGPTTDINPHLMLLLSAVRPYQNCCMNRNDAAAG